MAETRDDLISRMYRAGEPMHDIVAAAGVTRQGVYGSLKRMGIPRGRSGGRKAGVAAYVAPSDPMVRDLGMLLRVWGKTGPEARSLFLAHIKAKE